MNNIDALALLRLWQSDFLARAKLEIPEALAERINTDGLALLSLVAKRCKDDWHPGYLWYKTAVVMRTAFICDFHTVNSCHRAKDLVNRLSVFFKKNLQGKLKIKQQSE